MSEHRGAPAKARMRTALIVIAVAVVLGGGSVVVLNSANAGQNPHDMAGMTIGPAAEAVQAAQVPGTAAPGAGPVTEIDKTFLVKVRQAGLWEMPVGELAQTHATSDAVKRAGQHLLDGHSHLDQLVREDAAILGVQLPDQASAEQQGWVRQLTEAQGLAFDKLFVNLLRASHGKIFATIAEVRASTQNDLIRRHARQANQTVMDHMEVLEDTGLVDRATLEDVAAAVAPAKK